MSKVRYILPSYEQDGKLRTWRLNGLVSAILPWFFEFTGDVERVMPHLARCGIRALPTGRQARSQKPA